MSPPQNTDGVQMSDINVSEQNTIQSIDPRRDDGSGLKTGFHVTCKNLTVKVGSAKKKTEKTILNDLNFFLKPGSMTLMLGAPGCGKTSVMKVLADQLHEERLDGQVLFNGRLPHTNTHHRDVSYVVQEDHHMAPFTVKETFKFSADLQMPEGTTEDEKNERVDFILKTLGLEKQQDTVVGNEFLRGISGGQKKRVTIGVELVKNPKLFLMDEPTTGLDSQTSLELIKFMKEKTQKENISTVISLLQPGIEITKLFDFLMILNEGEMVYFGPMNSAIDYFEELGFKLPSHHNPAEFFQEIVNEPELYYPGEDEPPLRGPDAFAKAFKQSQIYSQISTELQNIPDPSLYHDNFDLPMYPTSTSYQIRLNSIRAFKMLMSSPIASRMRVIKSIVMGLILGSLYWNLSDNQADANNRSGLVFFAFLFIVFGGFGAIAILFEQREVFYIQKDGKYYGTTSFFLSLIFSEIPITLVETVVFVVLVYWMCGFTANAEKFIYFLLLCFVSNIQAQSFFKMVSAFSPNAIMASVIAPGVMSPLILMSGFMVPKPSIPGWWVWLYWISPITYGFQGLMSNEHHGHVYTCDPEELVPPSILPNFNLPYPEGFNGTQICPYTSGDQFLKQLGMPENNWFKWIDLAIVGAFAVVYSILMYFCLEYIHYDARAENARAENAMKKRAALLNKKSEHRIKVRAPSKAAKIKKEIPIGCYVQWTNLSYEVDGKKDGKKQKLRLLDEINGFVKPGMLLALMGPSGAGKSTLLDVLANRKTGGYTHGEILINGKPRDKFFTRISAYVEQLDILPPTQTVREAIQFSAKTRLPSDMPMEEKMQFVESIIETLNLLKISNRIIGHGEEGLSLSQRKRVNIGIELASDPQLLFLDEPTSGLDSSAALKVMNLIKKIASSGRSIICTIHQPSTSIFKKFDHLLLLKKGGETVFFGPTGDMSSIVLKYFEEHGLSCDPLKNPADFILEVTNDVQVDVDGVSKEFNAVEAFKSSSLNQDLKDKLSAGIMPVGTPTPEFTGQYSSTLKTQFVELFKRQWYAQTRRVQNIRTRIGRSIFLGIVLGTLYLQMDLDQPNIYNRVSNLFFSLMFGGMAGFSTIPVINIERGVFYREQSAGMYRIWIYIIAFVVTDIPWIFLSAIAYQIPNYFLCGFYLGSDGAPFFYQTFIMFLCYLLFTLLSMVLATVLPTDEIAHALGGTSLSVASLFAGFMIAPASIPNGWKWFYHLDPIKYPLEMVMVTEFKDLTFGCPNNEGAVPVPVPSNGTVQLKYFCPVTAGQQILDQYEMKNDMQYTDISVMFGYIVFFIICISIALTFIRHQTK